MEFSYDGRDFWQIIQSELLPFVSDFIALGIDDTKHEMASVLTVWIKGILVAIPISEIACERPESHAIHLSFTRSICAFYIHGKFLA